MPDVANAANRIVLVRGTELNGLPVVSILGGEALADIKDILYSPDEGRLVGFTLNKRGGLFAGPLKAGLPIESVWAIGRDAVMVVDAAALADVPGRPAHAARNVLGNTVLTDLGERLGEVTDLIVEVGVVGAGIEGAGATTAGSVVGYQLIGDAALQGRDGHQLFIPLPYALAISGQNLIVPASVEPFIRDDLSGFGGAVSEFRQQLEHPPAAAIRPSQAPTLTPGPPAGSAPAGPMGSPPPSLEQGPEATASGNPR